MKKFLALLLLLLLCVSPALAEQPRVIDEADVLTADDEARLEQAIAIIKEQHSFDIIIVTKENIGGRDATYYAADYFMDHGFGIGDNRDGLIVLLVTGSEAGNRDMGIASHGRGEKVFNLEEIYELEDIVLPSLRMSNYPSAMAQFVTAAEARLADYTPDRRAAKMAPILLLVGLGIGAIVAFALRSQMKSVRRKSGAANYVREGSFQLNRVQDIYLYTTTTRRRIETQSSNGGHGGHSGGGGFTSSSGSHFTGHSSKF